MALSPQELQTAKELKAKGVSSTMIMGHIAQSRQGKPSILSESMQEAAPSTTSRVLSDIPSDLKEGFLGVGEDLYKRGEKVAEAGEARMRGEQGFVRTAFQQLGQVAGGVGDIVGRGVTTAGKLFTTQKAEDEISADVAKIAQDTGIVDAYKKLQAYKEANPGKGRDIDAGLGILELALDRFGIGKAAKLTDRVTDAAGTAVDTTKQTVRGAVDAVSDIKLPNVPNVAPGLTQGAKDLAERVPRAISNVQEGIQDRALRAQRIADAPPAVRPAIKANVPDNTITLVTSSDAPTQRAMRQMLDVAESGERGARPSRVAGDAVARQYKIIDNKRKEVGKALEDAINDLPDATVDMRLAYKQLDDVLAENGIRVTKDGALDFSQSSLPTQQRTAVQRLYGLTKEAGDTMDARMVHAKDRMFSAQKRTDMKTDMLDDIRINVNGESKSIYDTFRDIYRNQLDNLDDGRIRAINKDYAILRNTLDEADNSIFKTSRTRGIELDPEASAMVNLRRLEGDALSTPYFQEVAKRLDSTSRVLGYEGAKPSDLITFAEDLRAIYPDTVPKAGFQGSIRTAIKPGLLDIADKVVSAGAPGVKDQQKALRSMIDDLLKQSETQTPLPVSKMVPATGQVKTEVSASLPTTVPQPPTPSTPLSTATRQGAQKSSSLPKSVAQKARDWYKKNLGDERGMINPSAMADDMKGGAASKTYGPLDIEHLKDAVEARLPDMTAPTAEATLIEHTRVPQTIKDAYTVMTGKLYPKKSIRLSELRRIQNDARKLYDKHGRKLQVNSE